MDSTTILSNTTTLNLNTYKDVLQETEQRHRQLLDGLHAAIYTCDSEGKITYFNKAAAELWGREPDLGKDLWCGSWKIYDIDGEPVQIATCPMAIAITEAREVSGTEIIIERPDGVKRNILPHPKPIFDKSGEVIEAVNVLIDITDLKQAQQALRESDRQFMEIADFMPQIVWTAKADGYIDYYNKKWFEFTGFDKNYGDSSWMPLLHPDDVDFTYKTWYDSVRTGKPYEIEYRLHNSKKPGTYRWFLGRALPIRNGKKKIVKWFGTCTDIHEAKTLTEELEKHVLERTKELQDANCSLQKSNEQLEQFAYVASHDLQEPLRKISTFTNLLEKRSGDDLDETSKGYIKKIVSSTVRMGELVNDILDYSKLNHHQEKYLKKDLNQLLDVVLVDFDLVIAERGAIIKSKNLPVAEVLPLQISRLFHNLISNSLKFSQEGITPVINISSRILLASEVKKRSLLKSVPWCEIVFKDNGIGFKQEYAEQIFEIFQRLQGHRKTGTGIGLAICKKIVTSHQGEITAHSADNEGAAFHITLPLVQFKEEC